MLNTTLNNQPNNFRRDLHPPVRSAVLSNIQTSPVQPHISQDLQLIFHKTLIPLSSNSPAINRKTAELNDDFGLLVCEIHALFKVIYNQGVVIDPDLQKLDLFEQRLMKLNEQVKDPAHTKKERKLAALEINQVKASIHQVRLLAKQLESYHPLSLAFGESEAKFVDRFVGSDHPGSALLATDELMGMLNDFSALTRNALDPSREKTDDDRIQTLYDGELEDLTSLLEEWSEQVILQTQHEIGELTRCLGNSGVEDKESLLRQAIAFDRQLGEIKTRIRNVKLPDPSLKPPLHSCILEINKQQRKLRKLISTENGKEPAPLDYGKDEWLSLVQKRPQKAESWINSTVTKLSNAAEWNDTVKGVVKTLFTGMQLFDHVKGIGSEIQARKRSQTSSQESPFKATHFDANPYGVSISDKAGLSPIQKAGNPQDLSFISQAPSAIKSVPIEYNLMNRYEKLKEAGQSLQDMHEYLFKIPPDQRAELPQSVRQLYQDAVNLAGEAPSNSSPVERADWMQSVDDLLYAKTVLEQEIAAKAIEKDNKDLLIQVFQNKLGSQVKNREGSFWMEQALAAKSPQCLKALLDHGADPNGKNQEGIPFVTMAVASGNIEMVELLLQAGANTSNPLIAEKAVERQDFKMLAALSRHGLPLPADRIVSKDFVSSMGRAIKENRIEEVKEFLSTIDINMYNTQGVTLLLITAFVGNAEVFKMLVDLAGIDINIQDRKKGYTALMFTADFDHREIIRTLAALPGIDLNLKDKDGFTALMMAAEFGHTEIVRTLAALPGINLNILNTQGDTALILAAAGGHTETVNELKLTGKDTVSDDIQNYIMLSHSWEIKGTLKIENFNVFLEGFYPALTAEFMKSTLKTFQQKYPDRISRKHYELISDGFDNIRLFNSEQALSDFKAGKPVFVSTGFKLHSIIVVFIDSYLMICNKGAGSLRPIEAYKIDPGQVTEEILTQINECNDKSFEDGFEYFFGKKNLNLDDNNIRKASPLLQKIGARRDDKLCYWLEELPHKTRFQSVGNCAWESLETAVYATIAILPAIKTNLALPSFSENPKTHLDAYSKFYYWEKLTKYEAAIQTLNSIEQRILKNPQAKNSMVEGFTLVRNAYEKESYFWSRHKIIDYKIKDIQQLIDGGQGMSTMEWSLYKIYELFYGDD